MRFDHLKSLCFSAVVFAMLFIVGFSLSRHKALWTDEFFTQKDSIDSQSYKDILTLQIPDGNKCPLFYLIQKINADLFSCKLSVAHIHGLNIILDARSQVITRIPSNVYMSLALAGIFYYFTRSFSLFTAIYALLTALVSPMVWLYWVEARPYSLWFLLTTAQLLFFCSTVLSPKIKVNKFIYGTHILLVLTTPGSILQISIMAMMLFLKGGYRKWQLVWTWVLPMGIFLVFFFLVPIYKFKSYDFLPIFFEAVMPERLFVYAAYALTAWVLSEKRKRYPANIFFLPVFLLFSISGFLVLFIDLFTQNSQFGFSNRYLVYLAPADILMFSLAGFDLWHWARKNIWVCMNVSIILGGLMVIRGLMTYREILASALYLHPVR